MNKVLYYFTRGFSSGITLLRTKIKSILSNLYIFNELPNTEKTPLIYDADYPNIYPQAYGEYLDFLGDMFSVSRNVDEGDAEFRRRILFSIGRSPTVSGIKRSIERLFETYGMKVSVSISESFSDFFDGTSSTFDAPFREETGSMLYGISIIIEPLAFDATRLVLDENGFPLYRKIDMFNFLTFSLDEVVFPPNVSWYRVKTPYLDRLISAFGFSSFKQLLSDIVAAGIKIDRVIVKEPGAGGNKGEGYYGN